MIIITTATYLESEVEIYFGKKNPINIFNTVSFYFLKLECLVDKDSYGIIIVFARFGSTKLIFNLLIFFLTNLINDEWHFFLQWNIFILFVIWGVWELCSYFWRYETFIWVRKCFLRKLWLLKDGPYMFLFDTPKAALNINLNFGVLIAINIGCFFLIKFFFSVLCTGVRNCGLK